ncbi:MAG: monovalent cation/H+ antiporter complex subunit F [Bacteroidales bacterium]
MMNIVIYIAFGFLLVALAITLFRLIKGPTSGDRIIALDLVGFITMGFVLVYSVLINKAIYFDIPVIISMVSFIGTIALSTYLKEKT